MNAVYQSLETQMDFKGEKELPETGQQSHLLRYQYAKKKTFTYNSVYDNFF